MGNTTHPIDTLLKQILNDFQVETNGVVLVHDYHHLSPLDTKYVYDGLLENISEGTLGVFGNESLNEHVALNPELKELTTQERMVLGSGSLLQLLTLDEATRYASHPSHLIGFKGRYAPYLSRGFDFDFPYGPVSIYNDLYGMDALVIHLGSLTHVPELKHVYSKRDDAIIQKNTALSRGEQLAFLDYDINMDQVLFMLQSLDIIKEYHLDHHFISVYRYQEAIDALKLADLKY